VDGQKQSNLSTVGTGWHGAMSYNQVEGSLMGQSMERAFALCCGGACNEFRLNPITLFLSLQLFSYVVWFSALFC